MGLRNFKKAEAARLKQVKNRFRKHKNRNLLARHGVHDFIVVLDNLKINFNIGKIFRSADGFGGHEIHLIGTDFFDPSPAKGSFKKVPARFYDTFADSYQNLIERGYTIFVLEPEGGESLLQSTLPLKSAFVYGHEEFGISFDKNDFPQVKVLTIPQFGQAQSLNVSIAASVVMYEYIRQHRQ
jgi:tRNA G18 (ribose-2'-O)-methylase SpoU